MNADDKKQALRMIPYGLYVLAAESADGRVAASTVNWVTQASFEPPLVAVGVKADSGAHSIIKESKAFALNILGKGQESMAFSFFKPVEREGGGGGSAGRLDADTSRSWGEDILWRVAVPGRRLTRLAADNRQLGIP